MKSRTLRLWLSVLISPLVIASLYLLFSRWPFRWFTGPLDWAALVVTVGVGAASLFLVLDSVSDRIVGLLLYVPVACVAVGFYSLGFVCAAFGDCL